MPGSGGLPAWLSGKRICLPVQEAWVLSLKSGRYPAWGDVNPFHPVFLPVKCHGQRSLAGYSPWGHKEMDMCSMHAHMPGSECLNSCSVVANIARFTGRIPKSHPREVPAR